jgi:hypothetical protein
MKRRRRRRDELKQKITNGRGNFINVNEGRGDSTIQTKNHCSPFGGMKSSAKNSNSHKSI